MKPSLASTLSVQEQTSLEQDLGIVALTDEQLALVTGACGKEEEEYKHCRHHHKKHAHRHLHHHC